MRLKLAVEMYDTSSPVEVVEFRTDKNTLWRNSMEETGRW